MGEGKNRRLRRRDSNPGPPAPEASVYPQGQGPTDGQYKNFVRICSRLSRPREIDWERAGYRHCTRVGFCWIQQG